jgi:coenzyme F420 hydrogenase subunit beta
MHAPPRVTDEAAEWDVIWGQSYRIARGHAVDPEVRRTAASGGVLSALAIHLLESEQIDAVLHIGPSEEKPSTAIARISRTRREVLAGARSWYAPAAPLTLLGQLLDGERPFAVVAKPCDLAAVENLARVDDRVQRLVRYRLTMVCGGVSQRGITLDFLDAAGIAEHDVRVLRYRGDGNPGPTLVEALDGRRHAQTYNEFWGDGEQSWQLQFRCKLCADSIGELADVVALDAWPGGAPLDEDEGFNAVIARTPRGAGLLRQAELSGAISLPDPLTVRNLNEFQPHQVERRRAVAARMVGFAIGTGIVPRFTGYRLLRASGGAGLRANVRNAVGTLRRVRAGRHHEPFAAFSGSPIPHLHEGGNP